MSYVFMTSRWIAISVVLLQTGLLLLLCAAADAASFAVTNPPAIQKVLPQKGEAGPAATTLRIAMCRGKYEPVQVVVHATDKPLTDVRVAVSDLKGPNVLPQDRIAYGP